MINNYDRILNKISEAANIEKEEIERRVEAKRAKLSGLISREGAAQVIAAELGINFDKQKVKINELIPGMRKVVTVGKVIKLFPVREFKTEKREGKVANMIVADDTGNVKVVLWDTNHIQLIEKGEIKEGDVVEIGNASLRNNEIHLGGFSEIKKSDEVLQNVKTEKAYPEKSIIELKTGEEARLRGTIVQIFEPRFFEVCPECSSRVTGEECEKHGKVAPVKRALLNFVIDDGTENLRTVLFSEQISKLIDKEELENTERFLGKRAELLGKEMNFSGTVRQNKLFNNQEFFVSDVQDIDIESLISQLEKR